MNIRTIANNGIKIARVETDSVIFEDVDAALDLMASVRHVTHSDRMIVDASAIHPQFFVLRNTIAGEILQKFVTYHMQLAIVGDFFQITSNSLRDFIYESNKGNQILFVATEAEAVTRLT